MHIEELEKLKNMNSNDLQAYIDAEYQKARQPIVFGYIRVSTNKQANDGNSLVAQENSVKLAGATQIYQDTYTGTSTDRPNFTKLLNLMREGDTLIVTKLDRIARSAAQGSQLIEKLLDKGIKVHVLNMGIIDNSPMGKLMRTMMLAFAEFERDMIVERTQEGKRIAKENNADYKEGRPRKYTKDHQKLAMSLLDSYSYSQVAKMTGISKATLYRIRKNYSPALLDEDDMIPGQTNIYDYIDK